MSYTITPKARTHCLTRSSDGTFGTDWTYQCLSNVDIKTCFTENFFAPLKDRLLPGDRIRIVCINDKVVTATAEAIVVSRSETKAEVQVMPYQGSEPYYYGTQPASEEEPEKLGDKPRYIEGDGRVERSKNSGIYKVIHDGKTLIETENKKYAQAVARGDMAFNDPQLVA